MHEDRAIEAHVEQVPLFHLGHFIWCRVQPVGRRRAGGIALSKEVNEPWLLPSDPCCECNNPLRPGHARTVKRRALHCVVRTGSSSCLEEREEDERAHSTEARTDGTALQRAGERAHGTEARTEGTALQRAGDQPKDGGDADHGNDGGIN